MTPMFAALHRFERIVVTGPQRSGTTIAARMIAHDTGHAYVDESEIHVDNLRLMRLLMRVGKQVVIQCPGLSRHAHEWRHHSGNLVVWMCRPLEDIVQSQERIGWGHCADELLKYGLNPREVSDPVALVKQRFWEQSQRPLFVGELGKYVEQPYGQLAKHFMWVPKKQRQDFRPRQFASST